MFWQQEAPGASSQEIYRGLMAGRTPSGLCALPMDAIQSALIGALPGMDLVPNAEAPARMFWTADNRTSVEFGWSDHHLVAELRPAGTFSHDVANRIIDVMVRFDCPLYDPQTEQ